MSGLDEFDPINDLPPDFMMIMYGMRRAGKTTALMHMLESMKTRFEKHEAYVMCGTGCDNPKQWTSFPRTSVFTDIAKINDRVQEIIEEQRAGIQEEVVRQFTEKRKELPGPPDQNRDDKPKGGAMKGLSKNAKKKNPKKGGKGKTSVIPVEAERGPNNDLERFPGELKQNMNENRNLSLDDIIEIRRNEELDERLFPHKLIILDDVVSEHSIRFSSALTNWRFQDAISLLALLSQ